MILDIILAVIFLGSAGMLWRIAVQKIPQLASIPDEAIVSHLHDRSASVRLFLLNLGTFYRERELQKSFWRGLVKFLHKLHIFLLQMDNGLVAAVKRIKHYAEMNGDTVAAAPRARVRVTSGVRIRKNERSDIGLR